MTEHQIIKSREKSKIKVGDKFDRLTVIENAVIIKYRAYFKCECKCGVVKHIRRCNLKSGKTKSCGCLNEERITKHGMCETATYRTWQHMLNRCNNPNNDNYQRYGGRGITVCKRWYKFLAFLADMGVRPDGLTIERKNNELGYYKDNCCWASPTIQARNKRLAKENKTGVRGVSWSQLHQKYQVYIGLNGKTIYLGHHKTIEDAKAARIAAEKKYWT